MALLPIFLRVLRSRPNTEADITGLCLEVRDQAWELVGCVVANMGPAEVEAYTLAHVAQLVDRAITHRAPHIVEDAREFRRVREVVLERVVSFVADRASQARMARLRRLSAKQAA
jgi:hypothetical protein